MAANHVLSMLDETFASTLYANKCQHVYDLRSLDGGPYSIKESVLKSLNKWFISYQQSPVVSDDWSAVADWIAKHRLDHTAAVVVSPAQYASMRLAQREQSRAMEFITHKKLADQPNQLQP